MSTTTTMLETMRRNRPAARPKTLEAGIRERATLAQALGDPTRLQILVWLARGEWTVTELARHLGCCQQGISHHLPLLRLRGLVEFSRSGKSNLYRLTARGVEALRGV